MSHFDYFSTATLEENWIPEGEEEREEEMPRLAHAYSENLGSYLARYATNARYKLLESNVLSHLDPTSPVTIMGKVVRPRADRLADFRSEVFYEIQKLPWSTYRNHFKPISRIENGNPTQTYTSDVGWGCTIRVGQMVLLSALSRHMQVPYELNPFMLANMISENLENSHFSLHKIVDVGVRHLKKLPGDWYAPSAIAHALHYLIAENQVFNDLKVCVGMDGGVFKDQILGEMTGISPEEFKCTCADPGLSCPLHTSFMWQGSILLFIPLMLGLKRIQPQYYSALKFFLSLPQSLGIIGGRPKSAFYFIGFQDDNLVYLDPHYVQNAPRDEDNLIKHIDTYRSHSARFLAMKDADSSMALAFFFDSAESFEQFWSEIKEHKDVHLGLVFVQESTPRYMVEPANVSESADFLVIE